MLPLRQINKIPEVCKDCLHLEKKEDEKYCCTMILSIYPTRKVCRLKILKKSN